MNIKKIKEFVDPFRHWEIDECLDENTLKEIVNADIPIGDRVYDGTRAADHTGKGIDGKLRLFISKDNANNFPYLKNLISKFQKKNFHLEIAKILNKDLSKSFVRLEVIADMVGFWLKPHKDIEEKLMTMMIWTNPFKESYKLGTDLYNKNFELVKTVNYKHNSGYFFHLERILGTVLKKKKL